MLITWHLTSSLCSLVSWVDSYPQGMMATLLPPVSRAYEIILVSPLLTLFATGTEVPGEDLTLFMIADPVIAMLQSLALAEVEVTEM